MKQVLAVLLAVSLAAPATAQAWPSRRTVAGVALGTALGILMARHTHARDAWVAVPVGALVGGLLAQGDAYGYGDDWYRDSRRNWRHERFHRHVPYPYRHYSLMPAVVEVRHVSARLPTGKTLPADPHPGVDLVKVSILHLNGIRTDIPILRLSGKFVGPQGEEYAELPTAETLAKRYGM